MTGRPPSDGDPVPSGVDRRGFLAAGGLLVCTLAGQEVRDASSDRDLARLARAVPEPAGARAGGAAGALPAPGPGGRVVEHWVRAERVNWTIVPTRRDAMADRRIGGRTTFAAWVYRLYGPGWQRPLSPPDMPGPRIVVRVGDVLVVHFENRLPVPVTMHPHGLHYGPEHDGAYKGRYTTAGGYVRPGGSHRYVWEARPGTEGVWPYHDHGPLDPIGIYKGLFGAIVVRGADERPPDVEHVLVFHTLTSLTTGLERTFSCVNGRAFAGNTPTLRARVGQRVRQHVIGLDDAFHTYHLHGHRWQAADGRVVDNQTLGPGDTLSLEFVEDNPGRWFYHCHHFGHLHSGMNGWYLVEGEPGAASAGT